MKTLNIISTIISFTSLCVIVGALGITCIWCGAQVATWVGDHFGICGAWKCLFLVPVMFVVSLAVCLFFSSGLRYFNKQ